MLYRIADLGFPLQSSGLWKPYFEEGLHSVLAARVGSGTLYDISAADPLAGLGAVGTILLSSTAANLVPARRAAHVAPTVALRAE